MCAKRSRKAIASTSSKKKTNNVDRVRRSSRLETSTTIEASMENSTPARDASDATNIAVEDTANEQGESSNSRVESTSIPPPVDKEVTEQVVDKEATEPVATIHDGDDNREDTTLSAAEETNDFVVNEADAVQEPVESFIQIDKLPWFNQLDEMEHESRSKKLLKIPATATSTMEDIVRVWIPLPRHVKDILLLVNSQTVFNNKFKSICSLKEDLLEVENFSNLNFYIEELISVLEADMLCDANLKLDDKVQDFLRYIKYTILTTVHKRRTMNDIIAFGSSVAILLVNLLQKEDEFAGGFIYEESIFKAKQFEKFNRNMKKLSATSKTVLSGLVFLTHVVKKTKVFDYTSEYFVDFNYASTTAGFGNLGSFKRSKYSMSFYEKVSVIIPGISFESILDITKIDIDKMSINEINSSIADRIRSVLFNVENLFEIVVSYKYFIVLFNNVASIKFIQRLLNARLKHLIELDSAKVTNNFLLFLLTFNGPTNEAADDYKALTEESVPFAQRQAIINSYIDQF